MTKRTIRYKRPEWSNWIYLTFENEEALRMVIILQAEGYIVEF